MKMVDRAKGKIEERDLSLSDPGSVRVNGCKDSLLKVSTGGFNSSPYLESSSSHMVNEGVDFATPDCSPNILSHFKAFVDVVEWHEGGDSGGCPSESVHRMMLRSPGFKKGGEDDSDSAEFV